MSTTSASSTLVFFCRLSTPRNGEAISPGDKVARGDLVEQRLEQVEVAAVDQRHVHRRAPQRLCCV